MSSGIEHIFGDLHPDAFKLFAGGSRHFYARLLEHLSEELFESAGLSPRGQVIDAIKEFCRRHTDLDPDAKTDLGVRANAAYARLLETGWLLEQRTGFQRFTDIDPTARLLLDFLLDVKLGRLRSYGGEVINVLALIESVERDPQARSEALRAAAKSSRGFLNHLRGLSAGMRKAEELIATRASFADLFESFFTDYVQKHLIADYKLLHTRANPFRFRVRILGIAQRILEDDFRISEIAEAYAREGKAADAVSARRLVIEDLRTVIQVFSGIDAYLEVIEDTNRRVETRIRNTIRFLDTMRETSTDLLEKAIRKAAAASDDVAMPLDETSGTGLPEGHTHLFAANAKRPEIAPTPIQRPRKSPGQRAREAAILAYQERSRVQPDRIDAYLREHVEERAGVEGRDLPIASLDDFFVFERLRSLQFLGGRLAERWEVLDCPGTVENDWITCRNFMIRPKGQARRAH
ncbi:Wadjet anti-phage system protein JetA family protein [Roseivivax sp. CAU 1761]